MGLSSPKGEMWLYWEAASGLTPGTFHSPFGAVCLRSPEFFTGLVTTRSTEGLCCVGMCRCIRYHLMVRPPMIEMPEMVADLLCKQKHISKSRLTWRRPIFLLEILLEACTIIASLRQEFPGLFPEMGISTD